MIKRKFSIKTKETPILLLIIVNININQQTIINVVRENVFQYGTGHILLLSLFSSHLAFKFQVKIDYLTII